MMYEIDLAWVTANPKAALDMIDRLMRERDDAKALAAASAAGYASLVATAGVDYTGASGGYKVLEGCVIVPKVPTEAMIAAGREVPCDDQITGAAIYSTSTEVRAMWNALLSAVPEQPASAAGWIVSDGSGRTFRTWRDGLLMWTAKREQAIRYARREDAEMAHAEDEDAWGIVPFDPPAPDASVTERKG